MKGIKESLGAFWNGFQVGEGGVRAYSEDAMPSRQQRQGGKTQPIPFPYIIYKTEYPNFMETLPTSVTAWFSTEKNGIAAALHQRAALCDLISRAIPTQGVMLPVDTGGFIILRRSDGDWMSEYTPEVSANVIGARIGIEVTNYTLN